MNLKDGSERLYHDVDLVRVVRGGRERGCAIASDSVADASWSDRSIDCATRVEFWDRFVDSIVGRWDTRREYSAQSTLRRRAFSRTTHRHCTRVTEYAIAPADDHRGQDQAGQSLHFHRDMGGRPVGFAAVGLLQPDDSCESVTKWEVEIRK